MLYGYARVSTLEQANGTSLDEQARKIQAVALMRGEAVAGVFVDRGISGSDRLALRPEGGKLVQALGPGDVLVVAKLDRIFRNAADALTMAQAFKDRGIDLVIADMGMEPVTQNGVSKMFFGMLALVAEFERERLRERQKDGQRAKRGRGGFNGGIRPFGFRVEGQGKDAFLVEIPEEQAAIGRIRELRAAGLSLRAIAEAVQADGHSLTHAGVQKILARDA